MGELKKYYLCKRGSVAGQPGASGILAGSRQLCCNRFTLASFILKYKNDMKLLSDFMASGVLELYVMGAASAEETLAVERLAAANPEIRQEIDAISLAMESYALAHAAAPRDVVKPLLLATIDYMERLQKGELPEEPPLLTPHSSAQDYAHWLSQADKVLPPSTDDISARIIGHTPAATTAIIWVKKQTDYEVHKDELERFLILEGTCNIIAGAETHSLQAGDFFDVPLHTPHKLQITSATPCKAILQRLRVAAPGH